MKSKSIIPIAFSAVLAFVFVAVAAYAATTISTDITTGAVTATALTVTGVSTFTNTATFNGAAVFSGTPTVSAGTGLVLGSTQPATASAGMIYYDSSTAVIKMSDGTNWFTVGTSTSGWTLASPKLYPSSLTYYLTVGTTTQSGLSVLTLEATTTASIPLTIKGFFGQTADLFRIHNYLGTNLFSIDKSGNASTTGNITTVGNIWFNGFATTTGTTGDFATQGTLGVTGLSSLNGNASTSILSTTGNILVKGMATTTASNGYIATQGFIGAGGTSTPTAELSAYGTATTTLYMHSTAKGGCIEMVAPNQVAYRMYISTTDTSLATTTTSGRTGLVAIWELGACR